MFYTFTPLSTFYFSFHYQQFIFIKHDKEQPDSKQAAILGTDADTVDIEYATDHYNTGIYDFLMKLPGINSKNIGRVMNCGGSLDQLIRMTKVS